VKEKRKKKKKAVKLIKQGGNRDLVRLVNVTDSIGFPPIKIGVKMEKQQQKKVKDCIRSMKAKIKDKDLIDCLNKEYCEHKISFGSGFFCRQSPLYSKPAEKVDPK